MLAALCLSYTIIGDAWPSARNFGIIEALFWGMFLLTISFPSAIIAWTEPDPLSESEA